MSSSRLTKTKKNAWLRASFLFSITFAVFFLFPTNTALAQAGAILDFIGSGAGLLGFVTFIVKILLDMLIGVFGFLLGIAGSLLDLAVNFTLDSNNFSGAGGLGPVISTGWTLIRDVINMMFIFVVLYIAITTILGIRMAGDKKLLVNLVVAALLINFSRFIAEVIIDAGNIVALMIKNSISGTNITDELMKGLKIIESFDSDGSWFSFTDQINSVAQVVVRMLIIFITMLAFLFAAILMIGRTVYLIFLIMASPIGFVGLILPQFGKYSKGWWEKLINQTLVAPVFLFFMYILILFINAISLTPVTSGEEGSFAVYFNFAIIVGVIIFAVSTTKKLSGEVAGFATTIAGVAGGAVLGGTALLARGTIGRGAGMLSRSGVGQKLENLGRDADGNAKAGTRAWIGRNIGAKSGMATLNKAQSATFDMRQTGVGKDIMGRFTKQTGIGVADYQAKGGFTGAVKRSADATKKRAASYEEAGFEQEASRIKKSSGVIADATRRAMMQSHLDESGNTVMTDRMERYPGFKAAFKGERAKEKTKKQQFKKFQRKIYDREINRLQGLLRNAQSQSKKDNFDLVEEAPKRKVDPATGKSFMFKRQEVDTARPKQFASQIQIDKISDAIFDLKEEKAKAEEKKDSPKPSSSGGSSGSGGTTP